jgi:hypothetical protein
MIKFFYATGDSFVFGDELGDKETPSATEFFMFTPYKRKHCYTGVMTDKLGIADYQNTGCPGGSNERAYRMLITDIPEKLKIYKPEEMFVTVSLTHATRREFCFTDDGAYYIHLNAWEPPKDVNPHHHRLWEVLVKDFDYNYGHFMFDTMLIIAMQNFLVANKIPYLFTSSMGNYVEDQLRQEIVPLSITDQIRKNRFYTNPSFINFAREIGVTIGPRLHPLEEGHAVWANHLLQYVNENNLLETVDL